jgi:hypothetical protein
MIFVQRRIQLRVCALRREGGGRRRFATRFTGRITLTKNFREYGFAERSAFGISLCIPLIYRRQKVADLFLIR